MGARGRCPPHWCPSPESQTRLTARKVCIAGGTLRRTSVPRQSPARSVLLRERRIGRSCQNRRSRQSRQSRQSSQNEQGCQSGQGRRSRQGRRSSQSGKSRQSRQNGQGSQSGQGRCRTFRRGLSGKRSRAARLAEDRCEKSKGHRGLCISCIWRAAPSGGSREQDTGTMIPPGKTGARKPGRTDGESGGAAGERRAGARHRQRIPERHGKPRTKKAAAPKDCRF